MNTETQKINQVTDFVIDEVKENLLKKVTKNAFKAFGWWIDASVEHAAIEEANKPKKIGMVLEPTHILANDAGYVEYQEDGTVSVC